MSNDTEIQLFSALDHTTKVFLVTADGTSIEESDRLILRGDGYPDSESALIAATNWCSYVKVGLFKNYVSADFGSRALEGGGMTDEFRASLTRESGVNIMNDHSGITVYNDDVPTGFSRFQAVGVRGQQTQPLLDSISDAREQNIILSDTEQLAFDLLGNSRSSFGPDARFITLMTAVELLIPQEQRPPDSLDFVSICSQILRRSDLSYEAKQSLGGSLRHLKNESIGQAGKRLAQTLDPRTYQGESAETFFSICYAIRSKIVHGTVPRPSITDVSSAAAGMELFVSDLLSRRLES